ncbi:MAG: hypothetical protein MI810_18910, partial [Flavobacteriales bacterium]|nr:hypothetical protein [Flavobacteriales bacterium]
EYCEARFYGSLWVVTDDAGNQYTFSTSLVTYRAPNNQRILNYNTYNNDQTNETGNIIEKNAYGSAKNAVLNVIEPKQSFTSWYCSSISNKNLPSQTIVFEYEKFGGFNYFKEFEQPLLSAKISSELRGLLTTFTPDYTAYTDIFLTKVTSQLLNSPFEILDLGYELLPSGEIGSKLLDPRDTDTERLDSLYSYKTVYSQGVSSDFTNWNRYVHGKSDSAYTWLGTEPAISNRNPYLTTSGNETSGSAYIRKAVPTSDDIEFAHSFLESPRILKDGTTLVPGDIYEIKSRITDNNASDAAMGTGTIDINIVTGTLETTLATDACTDVTAPYDSCSYTPFTIGTYSSLDNVTGSVSYPVADYEDTRGGAVFTTQNQAVKWHMAAADNDVSTSNFFVMPNVPSYYDGVNIQIGPGNSDTEYGAEPNGEIPQPGGTLPTAYNAYAHQFGSATSYAPYEQISSSFGIGVPWAMVEPLYIDQMGGIASNMQETDAFEFWWDYPTTGTNQPWDNEPTKFDEDVRLEEVELVRYSKSPYMLKTVQLYRVNGEFTPFVDSSGLILVAQREMDYGFESDQLIENMNYRTDQTDTLIISPEYNQYVYTLNEIKNIPVAGWENDPIVSASFAETEILQTEFEYDWYGYEDGEIMVFYADSLPYTAGRRTRVMTKYIDQLGGETLIEYYPRDNKSTLKEGRYFVMNQCAQYNVERIFPRAVTQDIHPAVHFLTKLDENNNLTDTSATNPLKRWEYVYDTTQIIYQTMDYNLPAKFRNGYVKNYSKGFAKTTVYQPELKTGEKPYTNYHHLGNVYDLGDNFNPTITEYLFFGKPSYIRQYDSDGILEEETIFSYDYTHAHENGYERPNFSRDNLISPTDYTGYTNWVHSKQYEYQDYYEGQSMEYNAYVVSCVTYTGSGYSGTGGWIGTGDTLYCTTPTGVIDFYVPEIDVLDIPDADKSTSLATSTISGEAAKPYKIASYLNNNWGNPLEKARFLEVFFFDDLSSNPDFYFDSYFVKTTQQIGRTYDDFCEKEFSSYLPDFPLTHGNPAQPFGPSFVNPYQTSTGDQLLISQINNSNNGQNVKATLISNSPLSEAVLDVFVTKIGKFKSEVIHDVLVEQPALSDNILDKVIQKSNKLQQTHTIGIFEDQPYLSDAFLSTLASTAHQHADKIIKPIYKHNEYLSDTIMHEIITASNFSQNALNEILLKQPQLSEEILVDLTSSANNNDEFVIEAVLLQQDILTDSIFSIVLDNSNLSHASVVKIFSESNTFPTDSVLLDLFSQQVGMSHSNILTVLLASPHGFGATLLTKIQQEMTATAVAAVLAAQLHTNPYGVYCENPIEEGRDYIESKVEYEYYEADYDGSTTAEGYQKLLGMEDLPRTVTNAVSGLGYDVTLTEIELKHQPSWQLFKVRSSS